MRSRSLAMAMALSAWAAGTCANRKPTSAQASRRACAGLHAHARSLFSALPRFRIKLLPSYARLGPRIVLRQGEEIVILPKAVDLEIAARHSFALEAGLLQHACGGGIVRQAGRLQPVQPERDEGEGQNGRDAVRHVPAADVRCADPVADGGCL